MLFRPTESSLTVYAPAKLNLFLELLGKRADGFHELETLMVSVGLFDTLVFEESASDDLELQIHGDGDPIPSDSSNLVIRAADLLRNEAKVDRGVRILLRKRIPVAAGLAGGSSNAAATLWALNRLWNCGFDDQELKALAAQLGSDIAFFLDSHSIAICRGRGEIVEPLDMPLGWHFVIAKPESGLSTADVYRACEVPQRSHQVAELIEQLEGGNPVDAVRSLHNALQKTAVGLNPDVDAMRQRFDRLSVLGHMMSGSGTAYFGVCAGLHHAKQAAGRLRSQGVSQVFVARSLA